MTVPVVLYFYSVFFVIRVTHTLLWTEIFLEKGDVSRAPKHVLKLRVNGRIIVECYMLLCTTRFHFVACFCVFRSNVCWELLRKVWNWIKRLATCKRTQQLSTLLDQKCWELLRSFTCSIKTYRWSDSSHELKVISWSVENKEKSHRWKQWCSILCPKHRDVCRAQH